MASGRMPRSRVGGTHRRTWAILIVTLIIVGGFIYVYVDYNTPKLSIDWRAKLAIFDAYTGRNVTIPTGIGVLGGTWVNHTLDAYAGTGYALLSTRDPSAGDGTATIYIQAVSPNYVPLLGDFFEIWGKPINNTCVTAVNYCQGPGNPRPWVTNGIKVFCLNFHIPFDNRQTWEIFVGTPSVDVTCK